MKRSAPSNVPVSQTKSVITVDEWESKAPLGNVENRSVDLVKLASENIPIASKSSLDDAPSSPSRPSTPALRNKAGLLDRPSTPASIRGTQQSHALHPKQSVQTPQQFYDWFAQIDRSVAHSQEAHFRAHLAGIAENIETCDTLLRRINEVETEVNDMLQGWRSVEDGGKNLKEACEHLLEERDRLLDMTDAIGTRLEYFQELENATRMLNHPGESLVLQSDFLYMVERVDICIDFLKSHRDFREAEIYLLRFQQCMTRAMTLIRMFFVGSLRALSADISRRISEKDVSATAQMHLLYTRFYTVSGQLAPLLAELEHRAQAHPDDLSSLLSECHHAYFSARKALLVPRLMEEIKGLDPTRTELVELTRAGCSYLKQLCTDEFSLYRAFFNSGEADLYAYLESLCDYLYDDLRPRILHEPRLTALCEVCTVLQALMVLDIPSLPESADGDESFADEDQDELNLDFELGRNDKKGLRMLHISHLLQMILQDAQTRLFFKAQSVIQADIRYYVAKPQDLAYPEILIAARKPSSELDIKEKESVSQLFHLKSLNNQDTWYPTLRRTVWVLSQLHEFVKPAIFDDIAQEAINLCRQSLVGASETLKSKNPPSSILDGQLFLVRHLLILKEMTQNLDFTSKDANRELDLSGVTDTLASMLGKTTSLLPNALFASLGMPRDENLTDVRLGIDNELKRACEDVIASSAEAPSAPLRSWVSRVRTFTSTSPQQNLSGAAPSQKNLSAEPWASQASAAELLQAFHQACQRDLHSQVARLRLYLEDDRTVSVLLKHVQDRIVDEYMDFREVVWNMYAGALRADLGNEEDIRATLRALCDEHSESAATHPVGSST